MLESQPYLSNRALRTPRAAAIAVGIPVICALDPVLLIENGVYAITRAIAYRNNTVWIFMFVLATNWVPSQVMPRWLALVSFALALGLLGIIRFTHWVTMIFPAYVFLISVYILILNFRQQDENTIKDGLTLDD